MKTLNERVKKVRTDLHLSQNYVSKYLGINIADLVEIESSRRNISIQELDKFCELFQIPANELLNGRNVEVPLQLNAQGFSSLDETDQQEIFNLLEFKRMMKKRQ